MSEYERRACEVFTRFADPDDHLLSRHGLKCAWVAMTGAKACKAMVTAIMANNQEGVSWSSFKACMQQQAMLDEDERVRSIFKAFDPTACGFITRHHTHAVFKNAAPTVSARVVDEVFDELDADRDGRISCYDFVTAMRTASLMHRPKRAP
ncbi:hypothetical protein V8C86DRAFT_2766556 [Haematococcus lacustris]